MDDLDADADATPLTPPSPSNVPSPIFFSEDYADRIVTLETRNKAQAEEIARLQKDAEVLEVLSAEAAATADVLRAEKADLQRKLQRAEQQLQTKQLENTALSGALSVAERLNSTKSQLSTAAPADEALQQTVAALQGELSTLRDEREASEIAMVAIRQQMEEYERAQRPPLASSSPSGRRASLRSLSEASEVDRHALLADSLRSIRMLAEATKEPTDLDRITAQVAALLQQCTDLQPVDAGRSPTGSETADGRSSPPLAHSKPLSTPAVALPAAFSPLSLTSSTATMPAGADAADAPARPAPRASSGANSIPAAAAAVGLATPHATPSPAPPSAAAAAAAYTSSRLRHMPALSVSLDSLVMRGAKVKNHAPPQRYA